MSENKCVGHADNESVCVMTWAEGVFRQEIPPFSGRRDRLLVVSTPARTEIPSEVELIFRLEPCVVSLISSEGGPVAVHMFRMKRPDGGNNLITLCGSCGYLHTFPEGSKGTVASVCRGCGAAPAPRGWCYAWHAFGECGACKQADLGPLVLTGDATADELRDAVHGVQVAGAIGSDTRKVSSPSDIGPRPMATPLAPAVARR